MTRGYVQGLKEKRERLAKIMWKEYTTRGNTQRSQELFAECEKIDAELKKLNNKEVVK